MMHHVAWAGAEKKDFVKEELAFPHVQPMGSMAPVDEASPSKRLRLVSRTSPAPEAHGSAIRVTPTDPLVDRVACSRLSVLISGETGVGKEVLARRLHERSARASRPFVAVNAAAICETLFESELFGYERGAFTGAGAAKAGLIEAADGGTLFLDEIGEMSMQAQAKLLRVLETRLVTRIGGLRPRPIDVRFVAATNRDLDAGIASGRFREDLSYRLKGVELHVPPLRMRTSEILPAAYMFLEEQARRDSGPRPVITDDSERAMLAHSWPGNFRELRNAIERAVVICRDGRIEPADLLLSDARPLTVQKEARPFKGRADRDDIVAALATCGGNQSRAARLLGISRRTLITRLETFGISRPRAPVRAATSVMGGL
jgi:DNA-binding NtrC family response regulator